MQLFMLPFAGANLNSYRPMTQYLHTDFDCHVIELPGRGSRFNEPLLEHIDSMITYCTDEIRKKRDNQPWGLFGHSLGAVLASLVCDTDTFRNDPPDWIVLSGRAAPGISVSDTVRHRLSREALLEDLTSMGGIQTEILNHPELIDLMEPVLRADLRAIETYDFPTVPRLKVPILVLGGTFDCILERQLHAWQGFTSDKCHVIMVQGGHFFIFQNTSEVAGLIREMSNLNT